MPYYITTISVSFTKISDENAKLQIQKLLDGLRENKDCTPYVVQIKKADHENKLQKLDEKIIKSLNIKS